MELEPLDPSGAAQDLRRAFHSLVRGFGLLDPNQTPCGQPISVSQGHALMELLNRPDPMQRDLGRALGLSKSAVSRMVAGLEQRGWVERRLDDQDGRIRRLSLSDAGRRVARRVDAASLERFSALLEGVPAQLRARSVSALEVLQRALPDQNHLENQEGASP